MSNVVYRSDQGNVSLEADGNFMARRKGVERGPNGEWPSGSRTRRSTLRSCIEWFGGVDRRATETVKVFGFGTMRDDQFDAGPRAHRRRGTTTTPRHRTLHRRLFVNEGDELVTDGDDAAKIIYDCVKVERRGFGRVVIDGMLDEELASYIDAKFPTVPVVAA